MASKSDKNSFVIYKDLDIEGLTLEQVGMLFKAMLDYENGLEVEITDPEVRGMWRSEKKRLDANDTAYQEKCKKNKRIAQEREKKKRERKAHDRSPQETLYSDKARSCTDVNDRSPQNTKSTDTDIDTDIDTEATNVAVGDTRACVREKAPAALPADMNDAGTEAVFSEFQNCGFQINQHSRDELLDMMDTYSPYWVQEAIKRSSDRGHKSLSYIRGILGSWSQKGAIDDEQSYRNRGHPEKTWNASELGEPF